MKKRKEKRRKISPAPKISNNVGIKGGGQISLTVPLASMRERAAVISSIPFAGSVCQYLLSVPRTLYEARNELKTIGSNAWAFLYELGNRFDPRAIKKIYHDKVC